MAAALSADRLLAALKAEGVKVVERPGWRTRRRPASTGGFGPINGVMIHHTVTSGPAINSVNLCERGHAALPGPLCHGVIAKDGTAYLISNGRANHAGGGDPAILTKVKAESYDRDALLRPTRGNANGTGGNDNFYGFECINLGNGKDPWPEAQRDAIVRASAAILRAYGGPERGWTAKSVIGHKEWSNDKIDPRGGAGADVSPPTLRQLIDERLKHPASWNPGSSTPTPPQQEDPLSRMTPKQIADAVLNTDGVFGIPAEWRKANPSNKEWKFSAVIVNLGDHVRAIDKKLDAQNTTIAELTKTVAALATNTDAIDADALVARIKGEIEKVTVRLDIPDQEA